MKSVQTRLLSLLLFFLCLPSFAQLTPDQIDSLVQKSMKVFKVPGMAVAVIKDGEIVSKKGYGVRSIQTQQPVNTQTLFGIASNTKAFTTAALAQLVDAGKIDWDTKVRTIIPEFKLYAPYVSSNFTIRDLLTHRSGLGLGAGDLMVFPAKNKTTLSQMIHNLRYLKPESAFRAHFDYDNLLYIVAGEIVSRVSGMEYPVYIEQHFFKPLQMKRVTMDIEKIKQDPNCIDGHVPVNGELLIAGRTFTAVGKPAAGIYASIDAMTKWVQARLNYGRYGENLQKTLFSEEQAREMWTPQTLIRTGEGPYNSHFMAYGLGWFLKDVNGYLQIWHTGGLLGILSQVTLIPELDLGIIVLTNQQSGAAFRSITNSIKDAYFGIEDANRIQAYHKARTKAEQRADSIKNAVQTSISMQLKRKDKQVKLSNYSGTFKDPWFGKVTLKKEDGKLRFYALRSPDLTGTLKYYKGNTFVVRWDERFLKADAFVNFTLDIEGKADGFTMKPISPLTDFSFDFQDLNFKRITQQP